MKNYSLATTPEDFLTPQDQRAIQHLFLLHEFSTMWNQDKIAEIIKSEIKVEEEAVMTGSEEVEKELTSKCEAILKEEAKKIDIKELSSITSKALNHFSDSLSNPWDKSIHDSSLALFSLVIKCIYSKMVVDLGTGAENLIELIKLQNDVNEMLCDIMKGRFLDRGGEAVVKFVKELKECAKWADIEILKKYDEVVKTGPKLNTGEAGSLKKGSVESIFEFLKFLFLLGSYFEERSLIEDVKTIQTFYINLLSLSLSNSELSVIMNKIPEISFKIIPSASHYYYSHTHFAVIWRQKFKLISFFSCYKNSTKEMPIIPLSLRYFTLYAVEKLQKVIDTKIAGFDEKLLSLIIDIIKINNLSLINYKKDQETENYLLLILNENRVLMKLLLSGIASLKDAIAIQMIQNNLQLLSSYFVNHINTCITNSFLPEHALAEIKTTHDLIKSIFFFLKRLKFCSSFAVKYTNQLHKLVDSLILSIFNTIHSSCTSTSSSSILSLYYVKQYITDSNNSLSRGYAELVVNLISSQFINFTASKKFPPEDTKEQEMLLEFPLITQFGKVISREPKWAVQILEAMIKQIGLSLNNECELFGLYKILCYLLHGNLMDNNSFYRLLFQGAPKPMDFTLYNQYKNEQFGMDQINLQTIQESFLFVEGNIKLIDIILNSNIKLKDICRELTENLLLRLHFIPALCENITGITLRKLIKYSENIKSRFFVMQLIQKLLAAVKYASDPSGIKLDKSSYLPLVVLDEAEIRLNRKGELSSELSMMLIDLVIYFLKFEEEAKNLKVHQTNLLKSNCLEFLYIFVERREKFNATPGDALLRLIYFAKGLLYRNDELKDSSHEIESLIQGMKERLFKIIQQFIKKEQLLSSEDYNSLLLAIAGIVFEAEINPDRSSDITPYIIKENHFLVLYLDIIAMMISMQVTESSSVKAVAEKHFKCFLNSVHGSYYNYLLFSNTAYFSLLLKLLKLMQKNQTYICLTSLIDLIAKTIAIHLGNSSAKLFLKRLIQAAQSPALLSPLLESLRKVMNTIEQKQVFYFNGKAESGISLYTKKVPKEGYCFFAWLRVERPDQSMGKHNSKQGPMTIYKFCRGTERYFELVFEDGVFRYIMKELSETTGNIDMPFNKCHIKYDTWYFVEFYHINTNSATNYGLFLYLNGSLAQSGFAKIYNTSTDYDEICVGCSISTEFVAREGEEIVGSNFSGAMSTIYFVEVNEKTIQAMHGFINQVYKSLQMSEIYSYCLNGIQQLYNDSPEMKIALPPMEYLGNGQKFLESVFLLLNPKVLKRTFQLPERIYWRRPNNVQAIGEKIIEMFNHVERVFKKARVLHNIPAKDSLINLNFYLYLIKLMEELAKSGDSKKIQSEISSIISLFDYCTVNDRLRGINFYVNSNGLQILRVVLEKLLGNSGLSIQVFTSLCTLYYTLSNHYPFDIAESYAINILLNANIWKNSSSETLVMILKLADEIPKPNLELKCMSKIKLLECFLQIIKIISRDCKNCDIIIKTIILNATKWFLQIDDLLIYESGKQIMEECHVYYERQHMYLEHLLYVLYLFLSVFSEKKNDFIKGIRDDLKKNKDCIIINYLINIINFAVSCLTNRSTANLACQSESKEDELVALCETLSEKQKQTLDGVLALSLYLLLSLDWKSFQDYAKSIVQNAISKSASPSKSGDPVTPIGILFKQMINSKEPVMKIQQYILKLLSRETNKDAAKQKQYISQITTQALLCLAFNAPFEIAIPYTKLPVLYLPLKEDGKIIADQYYLEALFHHQFLYLTPDGKKEILQCLSSMHRQYNPQFLTELGDIEPLIQPLFDILITAGQEANEVMLLFHKDLLRQLTYKSKNPPWKYMKMDYKGKLILLNDLLDFTRSKLHNLDYRISSLNLLRMSNLLEDVAARENSITGSEMFMSAFAKLLIFLDKKELLYVSFPIFTAFDEHAGSSLDKLADLIWQFQNPSVEAYWIYPREGGFLRITLRLAFLCLKYDKSENLTSDLLMQFIIFREKSCRKIIKAIASFSESISGMKTKKQKAIQFNLIDIITNFTSTITHESPEKKASAFKNIMEEYTKKMILPERSFLDAKLIQKASSKLRKSNFYEDGALIWMQLITNLFALMVQELFGVVSFLGFNISEDIIKSILITFPASSHAIPNSKFMKLFQLFDSLMKASCIGKSGKINDHFINKITVEIVKTITEAKNKCNAHLLKNSGIRLGKVYTGLDKEGEDLNVKLLETKVEYYKNHSTATSSHEEEKKGALLPLPQANLLSVNPVDNADEQDSKINAESQLVGLMLFMQKWPDRVRNLLKLYSDPEASGSINKRIELLLKQILSVEHLSFTQAYMHFLSTHIFYAIDTTLHYLALNQSKGLLANNSATILGTTSGDISGSNISQFIQSIEMKFSSMPIRKNKMEADDVAKNFHDIYGSIWKCINHELCSDIGLHRKAKVKIDREEEFHYVSKAYNNLIKSCPLYNQQLSERQIIKNPIHQLARLHLHRDGLGRAFKLKPLKDTELVKMVNGVLNNACEGNMLVMCNSDGRNSMRYVKLNLLKRILVGQWVPKLRQVIKTKDFKHWRLLNSLFIEKVLTVKKKEKSPKTSDTLIKVFEQQDDSAWAEEKNEYPCFSSKINEVELVDVKGTREGVLLINTCCIKFNYNVDQEGIGLLPGLAQKRKVIIFEDIKLMIGRRRPKPSLEVFLNTNTSYLFRFPTQYSTSKVFNILNMILKIRKELKANYMITPEEYDGSDVCKKMIDRWQKGNITNYEYLLHLNFFSGRSFHDITRYPLFPWLIQDYTSNSLKIQTSLRKFERSEEDKRGSSPTNSLSFTTTRPSSFSTSSAMSASNTNNVLYSSPPAAFYLQRLEPFSRNLPLNDKVMMIRYLGNFLKGQPNNCEAIPELFYLPEIFGNLNCKNYGEEVDSDSGLRTKINQIVLPAWCKNHHEFVRANYSALEMKQTSLGLNCFIDATFGLYSAEALLHSKHPPRTLDALAKKECYSIFFNKIEEYHISHPRKFALLQIPLLPPPASQQIPSAPQMMPIIFICAFEQTIFCLKNDLKIIQSKINYINAPHEKSISFASADQPDHSPANAANSGFIYPMKGMIIEKIGTYGCDYERIFMVYKLGGDLGSGNGSSPTNSSKGNSGVCSYYFISSRHYDDTFKIYDTVTGNILHHVYFHKDIVTTILLKSHYLFTTSAEGSLAKWDISSLPAYVKILWSKWDHEGQIVTIDASEELDLVITCEQEGKVILRTFNTGKYLKSFTLPLAFTPVDTKLLKIYNVLKIRLSPRGYIVAICRCREQKLAFKDYLAVYSQNGDLIIANDSREIINAFVISEIGYEFIIGTASGKIILYNLLTLTGKDIYEELDQRLTNLKQLLDRIMATGISVMSLALTPREDCQQLLIGLNTGEFYSYKVSPRITGGKALDALHGLIVGNDE